MRTLRLTILWVVAPVSLCAQSFASRIEAARDGTVRMSFAARPGVCGDGDGDVWFEGARHDGFGGGGRPCMPGPVRVTIGRSDGHVVSVRTRVGGGDTGAAELDLGTVPPADAARYLLGLASSLGGRSADDAVGAAAMADAPNVWPEFERLALDRDATLHVRKRAMFWLGQSNDPGAIKFFRDLLAR